MYHLLLVVPLVGAIVAPPHTKFVSIGENAVCGPAVPGKVVLCLGNESGLRIGGLELVHVGSQLRLVNASTRASKIAITTTDGATLVGPMPPTGWTPVPGVISVVFQPSAPTADGPWTVLGVIDVINGVQLQQVALSGTAYSGVRLLPASGPYVVVGIGQTVCN